MIFVTVGTHEQSFDRLIEAVDHLKKDGIITEEVIIQTGFGAYEPEFCQTSKLFPYAQMVEYVKEARIVITHGGPSSFIMPLQMGKIPIVVPRQKRYGEHVNDHQVEFAKAVAERMGNIIVVEDVSELGDVIGSYEERCRKLDKLQTAASGGLEESVAGISDKGMGNNQRFNEKLGEIVRELGVE
ncbi:MAG: multidrug MFS transporter [Clostridium sp.]|nr:multidrug MFS transporter [Clostridium sp.]